VRRRGPPVAQDAALKYLRTRKSRGKNGGGGEGRPCKAASVVVRPAKKKKPPNLKKLNKATKNQCIWEKLSRQAGGPGPATLSKMLTHQRLERLLGNKIAKSWGEKGASNGSLGKKALRSIKATSFAN